MLRPKSCANWQGTLYEYEKSASKDSNSQRKKQKAKKVKDGKMIRQQENNKIGKKVYDDDARKLYQKSVLLRKVLNDERITVNFVEKLTYKNRNASVIEVTAISPIGVLINRSKKGDQIEFNGFRCIIEGVKY